MSEVQWLSTIGLGGLLAIGQPAVLWNVQLTLGLTLRHKTIAMIAMVVILVMPSVSFSQATKPVEEPPQPQEAKTLPSVEFDQKPVLEEPKKGPGLSYAIGLLTSVSPEYLGTRSMAIKARPILAVRYGRIRISSSGGSSVLRFGAAGGVQSSGGGASAELLTLKNLRVKAALRINNGRDVAADQFAAGLRDVDPTVVGRLSVNYRLGRRYGIGAQLSYDLLNKGTGTTLAFGIGYSKHIRPKLRYSLGANIHWADSTHADTWYGIPSPTDPMGTPVYAPGGGFTSIDFSIGMTAELHPNWVGFTRFGFARALKTISRSPLTRTKFGTSLTVGIAYRCCK